jgi:hypothetical protein
MMKFERHRVTGHKMVGYLVGEYRKGIVSVNFVKKLKRVEKVSRTILTGGHHLCAYCYNAKSSSEHIAGEYIWPDMLAHYIEKHQFQPPDEFIKFILQLRPEKAPTEARVNSPVILPDFDF